MKRKIINVITTIILFVTLCTSGLIDVYAHEAMLDVIYDNCGVEEDESNPGEAQSEGDGINEMWYVLTKYSTSRHYSHETNTIKYYFAESSPNGYRWTINLSEEEATEIKNAYANSMKKWNNVYFYSYNSDGSITKNKIINVVEGSESDYNIIVFPGYSTKSIASTNKIDHSDTNIETGEITHTHYTKWEMTVYVNNFYANAGTSNYAANMARDRTGAHELGHVLGLRDIDSDNLCHTTLSGEHHSELLMGYGDSRALNITYKDIAGVAITRGFHTDADHMWLNAGLQDNGTYKLICSICNGVRYVDNLSGYTYNTYESCNGNHNLSSGNMMAVASYGDSDYYKCKYCRYVAPFDSISPQNYVVTSCTSSSHTYTNNVTGLNYTFSEGHSYTSWSYYSNTQHIEKCSICGQTGTRKNAHIFRSTDTGRYKTCIRCNTAVDTNFGGGFINSTKVMVSLNGSYIMPNGIIILVDEDIDAYLNGDLIFYDPNENVESI